ncbi:MAG: Fe-S-containing protein [Clostridia bacterium]|nr:Fe-S-containing protein [Clostridia bacterium]
MIDREQKRTRFEEREVNRQKRKKLILGITAVITVVSIAIFAWINSGQYDSVDTGNYNVGYEPNYEGKKIEMKEIKLILENGKAKIPIEEVKKNSIVRLKYNGDGKKIFYGDLNYLPILAYVSPSGRVVVVDGICQPCYSTRFYIEGKELVCMACGTRWRLSDLYGNMGGCVNYPPEFLQYNAEGEYLVIDEAKLKNWKPSYFGDDAMSGTEVTQ